MTRLSVNVNKIALLRNSRAWGIPDVVRAARVSIEAGAHGITVHPRPDQRHIRPSDVRDLTALLARYPEIELNIEGNPFEGEYINIVRQARPAQATLVPDLPEALTSDHGWDISQDKQRLIPVIRTLKDLGIRVSLFMDPDPEEIKKARETGTDRIELYTESYARAFQTDKQEAVLAQFQQAADTAHSLGLGINAGHDLNLANLSEFCRIPHIAEVSIGHALIADALEMGLSNAVKAYLKALS